ncbi:transporter substrate-binding domain-containing protein [endosymbiont of Lamellibrachia barhami]|uniref:transporter substrate-binding domain-containing protein n=1 Tax=endosymbiont of Lamellibrachia barhami TaxID=205975 RepID=UPI0015B0F707|nr:transporter substrate-binding domain-containing protein [endosymbiont of Lamellibrachia barhami]
MTGSKIFRYACLLLGLIHGGTGLAGSLTLTVSERQWLTEHPVIRIAPDPDFLPFERLDENGSYSGMAADYIRLIEKRLGVRFEIIQVRNWPDIMAIAQQRKVDLLPAIAKTDQRRDYLLFTRPYISVPGVLVSNRHFKTIKELRGHKLAVVRGYLWDELISAAKPEIQIKRVDDVKFGLELTALGAVDAMITDLASATSVIDQAGINNLHIVSDPEHRLGRLELAIGVRSDWPLLRSILDKVLASLRQDEIQAIHSHWIKFKEPAFWRDRNFWYSLLASLAVVLLLFSAFIIWNRMLGKQVALRTHELQTAQTQLMQAEKMESIGRLAAGVAHEVKNPLAIIQMGVDYLSQEISNDEISVAVIKDINDAVHRADTVIYGLLDFSRDKKLEMKQGNFNEVISSALHLVDHELRQHNITVQLFLAKALPPLELDSNKLQQVFINLFMNAVHAMGHNGVLQISSEVKRIEDEADLLPASKAIFRIGERVIRVEVADTGPGIREQDRTKIFELFYTTKAVGKGTGLGLSVSRNIINMHHGAIDITNRPEGGASVVVLFKLNKGEK